jgi:hypothetical protein
MSIEEVEAIFDGPPRDESTGPSLPRELPPGVDPSHGSAVVGLFQASLAGAGEEAPYLWLSDNWIIRVEVERGRVTGKKCLAVYRP